MKKIFKLLVATTLLISLVACSKSNETAKVDETKKEETKSAGKIVMVVNGNLGDRAFFDSAKTGTDKLISEKGYEVRIIETGADTQKWEPALIDAAESDADIIVAITFSMGEYVQNAAPKYPDKKFILVDATIDFESGEDFSNVYTATFKQNEGSFLSGALAALMTKSDMEKANPENVIGFLGGMDVPVINDFLLGYIEGAQYVDKDVKVSIMYPNDYYNPAKGKEYGQVLISQKNDVIFAAAGETGLGTIEAAKEKGVYIIGVDSDQAEQFAASGDKESASIIVTSLLKNVGDTIYRAVTLDAEGKLPWGTNESLGLKENGMGLAKNSYYEASVPEEIRAKLEEIEKKLISGEIQVGTAIGKSKTELDEIRAKVKP